MNKLRRKNLILAIDQIEQASSAIEANDVDTFLYCINTACALVHNSLDDEREYLGNMPDSIQSGVRGQEAEDAIEQMESALEAIEAILEDKSTFDDHDADIIVALEMAQG